MAKFEKGQSGNPGGRPKDGSLREAARAHTDLAIKTLADIMRNKRAAASARVMAANAILDRGYGKPAQTIEGGDKPFLFERIVREIVDPK